MVLLLLRLFVILIRVPNAHLRPLAQKRGRLLTNQNEGPLGFVDVQSFPVAHPSSIMCLYTE